MYWICKNKAIIFHFCYSNDHTDTYSYQKIRPYLQAKTAAIFTSICPAMAFSASAQ